MGRTSRVDAMQAARGQQVSTGATRCVGIKDLGGLPARERADWNTNAASQVPSSRFQVPAQQGGGNSD